MTWHQILGLFCLAIAILAENLGTYYLAWRRGYDRGWTECEDWTIKAGEGVDQARQEIWKEEAGKEQRWP